MPLLLKIKGYIASKSPNIRVAIYVALAVILWMFTGVFNLFNFADDTAQQSDVKVVLVKHLEAQPYTKKIKVTGISAPEKQINLTAQTASTVETVHAEKGSNVKKGDLLISLKTETRPQQLKAAKAALKEANILYKTAKKLNKEGFKADTSLANSKALLETRKTAVAEIEQDMSYTKITAPIDGIVERRYVEVGDTVDKNTPLMQFVGQEKFLIKAHLSQKEQPFAKQGSKASATLVNGQTVEGVLRFVATHADETTRTFPVEMEVDGKLYNIPTGMTATLHILVEETTAHLIPHSALVLNDEGALGVMTVTEKSAAQFVPLSTLEDLQNGIWITGLGEKVTLVIRGQNALNEGEEVTIEATTDKGETS